MLLANPVTDIRRTMDEADARCLTSSKEANRLNVHESYFLQVQGDPCAAALDLRFQFVQKLRLQSANQPDGRTAFIRSTVDS